MNGELVEWEVDMDGDGEVRVDGKVMVHWVWLLWMMMMRRFFLALFLC